MLVVDVVLGQDFALREAFFNFFDDHFDEYIIYIGFVYERPLHKYE